MQYNEGARLDPSQMGSGGRRGGGIALGGGMSIIVLILAVLFGFNPSEIMGGLPGQAPAPANDDAFAQCQTGADIKTNRECRYVAYTNSVQAYWADVLPGYEKTKTVIFEGSIATGCGTATSQVGPFFCPNDDTIYLDDGFFEQMLTGQLGAQGGDAAEAYVIAHEYGHHISNLTGIMEQVQRQGQTAGPNSPAVRLELQADCYAGVWLRYAAGDADNIISEVTQDDLDRAVNAAEVVGDDHIQRMQAGRINPDQWTHGSSQMRKEWLSKGFNSGDPNQCNTFAAGSLA